MDPMENLENTPGGPGQAFVHFLKMEDLMDKLKMLNYDKEFVRDMKMKPLNRHYFAIQTNPGEQFYLFTSLAGWLIRKCGKSFEQPQEYDDPNSTISSILDVVREFNVPINFPPNRLKQGFGENAIYVLEHLVNEAMKYNNIKWLQPEPAKETEREEEEEVEDEAELILEKVEEEMATFFSDDDDENILNLDDLKNIHILKNFQENLMKTEDILESTVNSEEWLIELERVLPQLKVTIKTDSRDWRAHLEQMQKYNQAIKENFSTTKSQLDKLHSDIVSIMDKISTREKHLNNHLESLLIEYKKNQEELNKLTEKFKSANERMNEKSKSLTKITEELESVKKEMEERGSSMTDGTPLISLKKAISKIKNEIVDLNIRIGVLENEILQGRLRDKTLQQDVEAPFSEMGEEDGNYVKSVSASSMVVVSNRLPFILRRNEQTGQLERKASAGGLVTAVAPVVVKGKGIWVGWPGIHLDDPNEPIPESDPNDKTPTAGLLSKQVVAVHCDRHLFELFYNGCCNGTFWPLFHSMPDRAEFSADTWKAYVKVNQEFARRTMQALETLRSENSSAAPTVWIHDYQLMICANWVRQATEEAGIRCKMGFFLHIPFPPWDIFRLFPWSDEILQGMLGCDMVGFHIEDYCLNFVDCCQRRLGCRVDRKNLLVEHGGRSVRVRPLPIGIPFERFVQLAESATRVMLTNQQIVLGVDRLDYTKGLVHRLKAFERLLQKYPQHIEKVTLLQIAVPSRTDVREYQELKEEMDQLVGRINGCFTTPNWSPIRYIYGCVSQDELAAFYRDAAVALVTPLRDGMNLVAKEFVACQINTPPGVLIVSPFAGAGEMMHEALVCNPYEIDDAAEVIHRALTMPEDERTLRMNYLRRREKVHDVNYWMRSFLKAMGTLITEDGEETLPTTMQPVTLDDFDEYLAKYIGSSHKLALLLDYDGTLAPIAPHPDLAILPPETRNVLERLSNQSDVYIAIISGRNVENVKKMVGIKGITYAGNHGLEILHPDGSKFVHPMPSEFEDKVTDLLKALQEQVCKEGAWVENKGALLTFHYRETPLSLRPALVEQAKQLIEGAGFRAGRAHCAIEAKPPVQWNKGRASIYILRTAFGVDWSERIRIIYAGDDTTDEDAMQALKGMAATFRITSSHIVKTAAEYRLPSTDSVLTMLKWVERHLNRREPREPNHNEKRYRTHSHRSNNGVTMEMSFQDEKKSENHIGSKGLYDRGARLNLPLIGANCVNLND